VPHSCKQTITTIFSTYIGSLSLCGTEFFEYVRFSSLIEVFPRVKTVRSGHRTRFTGLGIDNGIDNQTLQLLTSRGVSLLSVYHPLQCPLLSDEAVINFLNQGMVELLLDRTRTEFTNTPRTNDREAKHIFERRLPEI
jgi:hypothetical protein